MASPVLIFLESTLTLSAPLILAAMGGYTSERAGVINIGLEGLMLMSAAATALAGAALHNPWLGLGCGLAASSILSLVHWLMTQKFRVDHIVSGMAINAIAFGSTNFLDKKFTNPGEGQIPLIPVWIYYAIALILPFGLWWYSRQTRGGLRLLAVGSDPEKARMMGVDPSVVRLGGLIATGIFCGLSGAIIVSNATYFTDNMTAGRGFIALAALIIGRWRPVPAMLGCFLFGAFQALQIQLQGTKLAGAEIPREVWMCLPYFVTIVALAGLLGKSKAPDGLGKL